MSLPDDPTERPRRVSLVPIVTGETWRGLKSLTLRRHGLPPTGELAGVRIQWREYLAAGSAVEQNTDNGEIEVLDLADWKVHVKAIDTTGWKPGEWIGDVEHTDEDGIKEVFIRLVLPVKPGSNRNA